VFDYNERITVYRYHIADPVIFHDSIRVSIEHGHANAHSNDYCSTVYWYQTEPHHDFSEVPPPDQRIPRPDFVLGHVEQPGPQREKRSVRRRMTQRPGRRSRR